MSDDFDPTICGDGTPDEDHDWFYDGGDPDVGLFPAWICGVCGKVDAGREPPSDEDL